MFCIFAFARTTATLFVILLQRKQSLLIFKDIGYQKDCNEFTETKCRTVFDTKSEERCGLVYRKQCDMVYESVRDLQYEQAPTNTMPGFIVVELTV